MLSRRSKSSPNATPLITPSLLMRGERGLWTRQNVVTCLAVAVLCAAAITGIWIAAGRTIARQDQKTLARAKTLVSGQANILAELVRQEISTIDQSLAILQAAWQRNPHGFSLKSWESQLPALNRLSDDIFIANAKRVIVQDILPQAVGQGVGAPYVDRGNGTLESVAQGNIARETNLARGRGPRCKTAPFASI